MAQVLDVPAVWRCCGCKVEKPCTAEFFTLRKDNGRPVRRCKACMRILQRDAYHNTPGRREAQLAYKKRKYREDPAAHRARHEKWKAANPEHVRAYGRAFRIKQQYGISREEYEQRFATQGGRCAICHSADPGAQGRFHLDHDHQTGAVRAFLCARCNLGLGLFRDDVARMQAAAVYLETTASARRVAGAT